MPGKNNHFRLKNGYFSARNANITKFANFTGLYFPHFTIRNQTLQFYSFYDALSSYGNGFRSSCPDQNMSIDGIIHYSNHHF